MPEPPHVDIWTRYLFENPWPLAALLLLVGVILAWTGLREGLKNRMKVSILPFLLAGVVILTGYLFTTSGEQAEDVTRTLVRKAVVGNTGEAIALFADNAALTLSSPNNPGFDLDYIRTQLVNLARQYRITSNRITKLHGYTESSDQATVHLACTTEVDNGYAPTPSQWVLIVQRQEDDTWKITRITCISINWQSPSTRQLW